jgi:HD superfamily phosphohydrolase
MDQLLFWETGTPAVLHWFDRVYGDVRVDDSDLLQLIASPTFQRLRGIRQAGPSVFAFPFKTVTRFEHSLGVFLLLRRLGADRREQVAGLLHDLSHTAFSHAVDFLVLSEDQSHHEDLKPLFLHRPDITSALRRLGFAPGDFFDDSVYPLLEQPLPGLCADRLDYFLRDSRSCDVSTPASISATLESLVVVDGAIGFNSVAVAVDVVARYTEMNRQWWSGPTEAFIYNEFADAMREGMRLGALAQEDLLGDDEHVMSCLRSARSPKIAGILRRIRTVRPEDLAGYVPRVAPKLRWIDPPVFVEGSMRRLSEIPGSVSAA